MSLTHMWISAGAQGVGSVTALLRNLLQVTPWSGGFMISFSYVAYAFQCQSCKAGSYPRMQPSNKQRVLRPSGWWQHCSLTFL